MPVPDADPNCVQCLALIVKWHEQMEENENLRQRFHRLVWKIEKLQSKVRKLKRSMAIAEQMLERQDAVIDTLANSA